MIHLGKQKHHRGSVRIRDILVRIRIRTFDWWIRIRMRIRLRILPFSTVPFKKPTKNIFLSISFDAYLFKVPYIYIILRW